MENLPQFFSVNKSLFFSILLLIVLLVLLLFVIKIFRGAWLFYKRSIFKEDIEWTLLEILIPREIKMTPRAMEQFLMNIHGLRNAPGDFLEKYIEGEITLWWSFEVASFGGEIHFYIRMPKKHKKMTEAGLYAQYPDVEVIEVDDYLNKLPKETKDIYKKGYNIFGGEFVLKKEDVYPITTYHQFELAKDEMALDPISALIEALANIHKEEFVFFQILLSPAGPEWQEEGRKLIDELAGRAKKPEEKKSFLFEFIEKLFWAPAEHPIWGRFEKKEEKEKKLMAGEEDLIKALEDSISRPGFDSLIRYIYYAPVSIFSTNFARRGLLGALNQYASQKLNSFRGNRLAETRARWINSPYIFVEKRVEGRKQRLLHNFFHREMPEKVGFGRFYTSHIFNFNDKSKSFILNTAEAATIFHPPTEKVLTAPHIKLAESKRLGPPAGLPIFKTEKEEN